MSKSHGLFQEGKAAENGKLIQEEQDAVLELHLAIACFTFREAPNDEGDEQPEQRGKAVDVRIGHSQVQRDGACGICEVCKGEITFRGVSANEGILEGLNGADGGGENA